MRTILLIITVVLVATSAEDLPIWERLGIGRMEYKAAVDAGMTVSDIGDVLSVGVSIKKHLSKPWEALEITKNEWYALVRSGLDSTGIADKVYRNKHKKTFRQKCNELAAGLKEGAK